MGQEALPSARIPTATYRLQFNRQFTFSQAKELAAYLHDLGIGDLYASSFVAAKEGSVHGYDVVNHTVFNREIGNEESYRDLTGELRRLEMGLILDFVPNHMCVDSPENLWWMDVLESGPSSPYASFFDIDWQPLKKELTNKVLLPFLGDQYGQALERGELRLVCREGAFFVTYAQLQIPLEPRSYLLILGHRPEQLQQRLTAEDPALLEFLSIITALQHLPFPSEQDPGKKEERYREKEIIKKRLGQLCQQSPEVAAFLEENLRIFNGIQGEPRSFDLLDALLLEQSYRLSYWRVATDEINYRRFFDINSLAAIRMEDRAVFEKTHPLLLRLIREGSVTGVRIDHVDGLYDPLAYLHSLQQGCFVDSRSDACADEAACGKRSGEADQEAVSKDRSHRPLYVVCEKILMKGEQLPEEWPVFGTTGYGFLNNVNGIFVDTENAKAFDRIYDRFVGRVTDFQELVYEKKRLVMQVALSGEVNMLGHQLNTISEQDRLTRDFTLHSLTRAIREVIACFPVYRTYVNSGSVREKDSQYVESAVSKAKRKNPAISASIFDFLRSVLLLKFPEHATQDDEKSWLYFVMRFQQITGPVMAKGLEDTAFYVYNRLLSLNDVGGAPGRFGISLEAFHGQNLERAKNFPHAMLATATHDTKRGEDGRTRIDALSEIPRKWQRALVRWTALNKERGASLDNQPVPDRNEEYLLYQALLGAWPLGEMDQAAYADFGARIREYMIKATREAKVNTSWVAPNTAHEEALTSFVDAILAAPESAFLQDFASFRKQIAHYGMFSSLSQTLLKMTSPGVPDFYQGTELWDFSLVDPDNRRPVDYAVRVKALAGLRAAEAEIGPKELFRILLDSREDGRIKLYIIYRCLNFRRDRNVLFRRGDYRPLEAKGAKARHVCAFARQADGGGVIAVVPRLLATLVPDAGQFPQGEQLWEDTSVSLPRGSGLRFRNVLTDELVNAVESDGALCLPLAGILETAPVALLSSDDA
jgi:(1->4)-alpha-D-glucan 1-alpha-D-glucosylmutase